MKKLILLFSILGSLAVAQGTCNPPVEPLQVGMVADETISQRMKEIFDKDQSMRMTDEIDWAEVSKIDQEHRVEVMTFIKDRKLATGFDFYYAAFVFQHGNCPDHYKLANELAEQAINLFEEGEEKERAKWIYAASLDRYLLSTGEVQKFGTQYTSADGCTYALSPVDPATTDEERASYNVPSLAEAEKQAKEFSDCKIEESN
jgi:hypothetical protein